MRLKSIAIVVFPFITLGHVTLAQSQDYLADRRIMSFAVEMEIMDLFFQNCRNIDFPSDDFEGDGLEDEDRFSFLGNNTDEAFMQILSPENSERINREVEIKLQAMGYRGDVESLCFIAGRVAGDGSELGRYLIKAE